MEDRVTWIFRAEKKPGTFFVLGTFFVPRPSVGTLIDADLR